MTQKNWVESLGEARVREGVGKHEAEQRDAVQAARREFVEKHLNPLEFYVTQSGNLYSEKSVTGARAIQIMQEAGKHGLGIQVMSQKLGERNVALRSEDIGEHMHYKLRLPKDGSLSAQRALEAGLTSSATKKQGIS